jgi:tetratricopeptide (TPR) repeat protein
MRAEVRPGAVDGADPGSASVNSASRRDALLGSVLIALATLLAYSNAFNASFHFDDHHVIVENEALRSIRSLWPPSGNRWVGYLSFALNYQLGGLSVFGYHLVNLIIHVVNGILVSWLTTLILQTPALRSANWRPLTRRYLPLTTGLLFALHPVATQAVTYVAQRFTSLATLFCLSSIALYVAARLSPWPSERASARVLWQYGLAIVAAVAAMRTKEISFTLPFVVVGFELVLFGQRRRLLPVTPIAATALLVIWGVGRDHRQIADVLGDATRFAAETSLIPRSVYLVTQTRVVVRYLQLLFLPIGQNLDYEFPLSGSVWDVRVLLAVSVLIAVWVFVILLFQFARRANRPEGTLVFLGTAWFFVTLSVESSIIPIVDVINEHRMYLPAVGGAIVLGTALLSAVERVWPLGQPALRVAAALLVYAGPLGVATYARNRVWKDEVTLWSDVVSKSPNLPRAHNNLAEALLRIGDSSGAVREAREAIRLSPRFAQAHGLLAEAFFAQGRIADGIPEARESLRLDPTLAIPHVDLGDVYASIGRYGDAVREYQDAIRVDPRLARAHINLGVAYERLMLPDEATREYRETLRLEPGNALAHYFIGNVLYQGNHLDDAIREYREAIRLDPGFANARCDLGHIYFQRGQFAEAVNEHREAIRVAPRLPLAHDNLADDYQAVGLFDEAARERREAARLARDQAASTTRIDR